MATRSRNLFLVVLLGVTLFHLFAASYIPPVEDELYYWTWSKNLSLSYFDHPPLVAWTIKLGTLLLGDTPLGIRCVGLCLASLTAYVLFTWSGLGLGLAFLFSPLLLWGAILITPDIPFLFFWVLYIAWLRHQIENLARAPLGDWVVGGILLGLGLLSKYPMILAVPLSGLVFWRTPFRQWRAFTLTLAIAFVIFLPVMVDAWRTDFASFYFQLSRTHNLHPTRWAPFGLFFSQVFMVGALPFLLFFPALFSWRQFFQNPSQRLFFIFSVVPMLYLYPKAARHDMAPNWIVFLYPPFWPIAQALLAKIRSPGLRWATLGFGFCVPWLASLAFLIHLFYPIPWIPPAKDRFRRIWSSFHLSEQVAQELKQAKYRDLPVFVNTYQWVSYLRYQKIAAEQLHEGTRASQFTREPVDACQFPRVLVVSTEERAHFPHRCFTYVKTLKMFPLWVAGEQVQRHFLLEYWR